MCFLLSLIVHLLLFVSFSFHIPQYSYEANVGEYEAQVSVVWNGDHFVGSLPVTLYKCDILGSHRDHPDCSLCVTRAKKYRCAWCGSVCAYSESCPVSAASECPRPRIDVVRISNCIFILLLLLLLLVENRIKLKIVTKKNRGFPQSLQPQGAHLDAPSRSRRTVFVLGTKKGNQPDQPANHTY